MMSDAAIPCHTVEGRNPFWVTVQLLPEKIMPDYALEAPVMSIMVVARRKHEPVMGFCNVIADVLLRSVRRRSGTESSYVDIVRHRVGTG